MPSPLRPPLLLAALLAFALPARAQRAVTAGTEERARQAVAAHAAALGGAEEADADALAVTDAHTEETTGLTFVYLAQTIGGVPVDAGRVVVGLGRDGAPFHVAGALVPGVAAARPRTPALAPGAALATARAAVPGSAGADAGNAEGEREANAARLVYVGSTPDALRLAWRVMLPEAGRGGALRWRVDVDAAAGEVLAVTDLAIFDAFGLPAAGARAAPPTPLATGRAAAGSYRVYAYPTESPAHAGDPATDLRTLVADPHDALASPHGWHDTDGADGAEHTTTRGNNVSAAPNPLFTPPRPAPDGGPALAFDFPFDPAQSPTANVDAAVTNAFYWANLAHDVLYRYGFTEAAGNFQQNTYGRGGLGGDPVRLEIQDPHQTNSATFFPTRDGVTPTLSLGRWTYTDPARDPAFDGGVVVHEYAHGLSTRLVGGLATLCLAGLEQPGEGWSDLVALLLTMRPGDTRHTPRGIAAYGTGQTPGGTIRPAPYATDFAVNPYTYGSIRTMTSPHAVGFVWATAVWEATWDLIDAHGWSPDVYDATGTAGNQVALRLLVAGLKLTPCEPGFVDARDAILAADEALYGGAHRAVLWRAFARRGLGASARQGSPGSLTDNVEAFDLPLPLGTVTFTPGVVVVSLSPGETTPLSLTVRNMASPGAPDLTFEVRHTFTDSGGRPAPPEDVSRMLSGLGYEQVSSDEPGGPPVSFYDLRATGTRVAFTQTTPPTDANDEGYGEVTLPFAFPFYGAPYTRLYVSTNGFLSFLPFSGNTGSNAPIPTTGPPNALLAPYWDDLRIEILQGPAAGGIYTGMLEDGRFAVHFHNVQTSSLRTVTFEVLLSPNGTIEFQYDTPGDTPITVGIENETGQAGVQTAYDTPYVRSRFAVRYRPPTVLTVWPLTGDVPPGSTVPLLLTFDASGLAPGSYEAELHLITNELGYTRHRIPITLNVLPGEGEGTEAPTAFALAAPAPNPTPGPVTFRYDVPTAGDVTLEVLDVLGRRVAVIAEGAAEPGSYTATWNTGAFASGTYVVRMRSGAFVGVRRLTVAR